MGFNFHALCSIQFAWILSGVKNIEDFYSFLLMINAVDDFIIPLDQISEVLWPMF